MPELDVGKVFIAGLSDEVDEQVLTEAFEEFGTITKATVIRDQYDGHSKGFGFVLFEDPKNCQPAIDKLDKQILSGATIHVELATLGYKSADRGRGDSRGRGFRDRGGRGFGRGRGFGGDFDRGGRGFRSRGFGFRGRGRGGGGYDSGFSYDDRSYMDGFGDRSFGNDMDNYSSHYLDDTRDRLDNFLSSELDLDEGFRPSYGGGGYRGRRPWDDRSDFRGRGRSRPFYREFDRRSPGPPHKRMRPSSPPHRDFPPRDRGFRSRGYSPRRGRSSRY